MSTLRTSTSQIKSKSVRSKPPAPACPNCGDQFTLYEKLDTRDRWLCVSCNNYFCRNEIKKHLALTAEWESVLAGTR